MRTEKEGTTWSCENWNQCNIGSISHMFYARRDQEPGVEWAQKCWDPKESWHLFMHVVFQLPLVSICAQKVVLPQFHPLQCENHRTWTTAVKSSTSWHLDLNTLTLSALTVRRSSWIITLVLGELHSSGLRPIKTWGKDRNDALSLVRG